MKKKLKNDLFELIQVMHSITSEHDLEKLLKLIVTSAVEITHSDAASLYLSTKKNYLKFVVTTNKTLESRLGKTEFEAQYKSFDIAISKESISGFVAATGKLVNIEDVYHIKGRPFTFNKSFDEANKYRTRSMLSLPLVNRQNQIIGVLQLINKLNKKGKVAVYKNYDEEIATSLGAQAAIAIDNVKLTNEIQKAHFDSIMRLSAANEFRDNETGFHVKRVSFYSELLAKAMDFDSQLVQNIKFASPLHDIGKIGIPDHILKKPGKLTAEEYTIMQTHTSIGGQILRDADDIILSTAKEIALTHHEKWDGSGYPNGLKGEAIPISGRITAIADVFDALSNKRIYKPAYSLDDTFNIIKKDAGTHFDPNIVEKFLSIRDDVEAIFDIYKDNGEKKKKKAISSTTEKTHTESTPQKKKKSENK